MGDDAPPAPASFADRVKERAKKAADSASAALLDEFLDDAGGGPGTSSDTGARNIGHMDPWMQSFDGGAPVEAIDPAQIAGGIKAVAKFAKSASKVTVERAKAASVDVVTKLEASGVDLTGTRTALEEINRTVDATKANLRSIVTEDTPPPPSTEPEPKPSAWEAEFGAEVAEIKQKLDARQELPQPQPQPQLADEMTSPEAAVPEPEPEPEPVPEPAAPVPEPEPELEPEPDLWALLSTPAAAASSSPSAVAQVPSVNDGDSDSDPMAQFFSSTWPAAAAATVQPVGQDAPGDTAVASSTSTEHHDMDVERDCLTPAGSVDIAMSPVAKLPMLMPDTAMEPVLTPPSPTTTVSPPAAVSALSTPQPAPLPFPLLEPEPEPEPEAAVEAAEPVEGPEAAEAEPEVAEAEAEAEAEADAEAARLQDAEATLFEQSAALTALLEKSNITIADFEGTFAVSVPTVVSA